MLEWRLLRTRHQKLEWRLSQRHCRLRRRRKSAHCPQRSVLQTPELTGGCRMQECWSPQKQPAPPTPSPVNLKSPSFVTWWCNVYVTLSSSTVVHPALAEWSRLCAQCVPPNSLLLLSRNFLTASPPPPSPDGLTSCQLGASPSTSNRNVGSSDH